MGYKKCPFCGEKVIEGKSNMFSHVERYHSTDIPTGKTAGEYLYLHEHDGRGRKCMMCPNTTNWNTATEKYNAFCSDKCKENYVKMARARLKKLYGKENLLDDPDQQKKMLANRRISGVYHHSDGGSWQYTGTYEEDFCRMNDTFLSVPSEDILMPSPNVYEYMYEGVKKFYIPDAFIASAGIEIEIKDGGDNPNMHHKIQEVDKVKEKLKDRVMEKQRDNHYIKIVNKNYKDYFGLMEKIRNGSLNRMEESRKIKIVPEDKNYTALENAVMNIGIAEGYLLQMSEDYGIDYFSDKMHVQVCESSYESLIEDVFVVHEGVLKTLWNGAVTLVRTVIKTLIYLWKRVVEFVKLMLNKVMGMFNGKPSNVNFKPTTVNIISLEAAQVRQQHVKSFKELESIAVSNIETISREVRDMSRVQIDITKRIEREVEHGEQSVSEAKIIHGGDLAFKNDDFKKEQIQMGIYDEKGDTARYSTIGKDLIDNEIKLNNNLDVEAHKALLKSNDIVADYNMWADCRLDKIIHSQAGDLSLAAVIAGSYRTLTQIGVKDADIRNYLKGKFFNISDKPEVIKKLLHLRLNYNKKMISLLENMIRLNYHVIGITSEMADSYIARLKSGDSSVHADIASIIKTNIDKFATKPGVIDYRPLKAGIIFYTKEDLGVLKGLIREDPTRLFNLAMRYDCICLGHGGISVRGGDRKLYDDAAAKGARLAKMNDLMREKHVAGKEITKDDIAAYTKVDAEYKHAEDAYGKSGEKMWHIQPIATEHHSATSDVDELTRNCIAEGYKKILLMSCNPGHLQLADDIRNNHKGVIIHMSNNTLIL